MHGAKRPANDADVVLKYLGYWTDNGAAYYYNYNLTKATPARFSRWWSVIGRSKFPSAICNWIRGGITRPPPGADGKPGKEKKAGKLPPANGIATAAFWNTRRTRIFFRTAWTLFKKRSGLPLITHNRWIDPASPYHQHYKISGLAAVDPKWWDSIADYMKTSGIVTYEQDWLDRIYTYSPAFSSDVGTGEAFLDNMARACKRAGNHDAILHAVSVPFSARQLLRKFNDNPHQRRPLQHQPLE